MADRVQRGPLSGGAFPGWMVFFFIISALVKLWLTAGQSVSGVGRADLDERLFLRLAQNILAHGWLGSYTHTTLVKGPFYPFFIALSFALGVPLLLSQQLLYIAACVMLIIAVRPVLRSPSMLLVLWTSLLLNPMSYADGVMTWVVREGIYPALTVLVVSCAAGILARRDYPLKKLRFWAAGLGVSLSALWLTREEGVWILPFVFIISGAVAVSTLRARPVDWRRLALLCVLPFFILIASLTTVAGINKIAYGVFATVELKSKDFLDAYGALTRVRPARLRTFVPVPEEVRERIYTVSPAFAELRPFLEGDMGKAFTRASCQVLGVCNDIAGGWFIWAFRQAAFRAGHHTSGASASVYYGRIAREINAACAGRKLDCAAERASLMPPWNNEYAKPVLADMVKACLYMVRFEGFIPHPGPTEGTDDQMAIFRDLTRDRLSPRAAGDRLNEQAKFDDIKIAVLGYIGKIYRFLTPFAAGLALILYIYNTARLFKRKAFSELWIICTALLVAIIVMLLLLSVIDVTSFTAINPLYLSPVYPLLFIFVVLSFADWRLPAGRRSSFNHDFLSSRVS
jgi:hypothetical protein